MSLSVRVQDEPVECLPWTRRTGVCRCFPCFGNVSAHSGRRWPRPRELRCLSQVGSCLYVTAAVRGGRPRACRTWSQRPKFVQGSLEPVGALVFQVMSAFLPAMSPSPAGLAPMEGIPMRAQAILHREILHVHALLDLTTTLLRTRLAILSPTFLACVTSPHLEVQIRGLDSAIRQATQAIHTGLHYTQAAELRGTTTFRDPRLPSPRPQIRPPASGSYSARGSTTTTITPDDGDTLTTRTPSTTRPSRGFVVATSTRPLSHAEIRATMNRSRSRSRPRLNPRDT